MPTGVASLAGAKQRFSRNAIWNLLGFLTQIGCAFVVVPILVHGLGGVQYGIWTLIGQTITGMNLLDFGLSIGVGRFFARHHAQDDREEISRLLSTGLAVSIIPAALMLLGGAALAIWAPRFFHFPPALDLQVRVAIMLVALAAALMIPGTILGSAIPALSRFDLQQLRNILWFSLRALLYWVALQHGLGLVGVAAVALGVELAGLIFGAVLAMRLVPWVRLSRHGISMRTLRPLMTFSFFAFLLSMSSQLIFYSDNIVVGAVLGPLAVAYFSVAGGLVDQLRGSLKIVTTLYANLAAQIHAIEGLDEMQQLFLVGSRLAVLLVLPGCIGLVLLGPEFLQLWLGPVYRMHSMAILMVLIVVVLVFAISISCTQVLYGMNRHRVNAYLSLTEACTNLGLSIILVRYLGAIGVAWGTLIPALVFELCVLPIYTVRQLKLGTLRYVGGVMVRPALVGGPMAAWCWLCHQGRWVRSWHELVLAIAAGLVAFAIALRAYGLEAPERALLQRKFARLSPRARRILIGPLPASAAG
ncbi:MAG TPA: oligosaccharide flippase family protein [Terriglobales bacterium]|nr:oligosaccharide flippase family protein [Terriglobales bacterium]